MAIGDVRCVAIFLGNTTGHSAVNLNNTHVVDGDKIQSIQVIVSGNVIFPIGTDATGNFSNFVSTGNIIQISNTDLSTTTLIATVLKGS